MWLKSYHVTTFGCQMNAHDSERVKGLLEELGLGEATAQDEADVLVLNTCTIREKPDTRLAAHLGNTKALKDADPGRVVAVVAATRKPSASGSSPSDCPRRGHRPLPLELRNGWSPFCRSVAALAGNCDDGDVIRPELRELGHALLEAELGAVSVG